MTGFAARSREADAFSLGVTIKSVNHRYLDLQLRLPPVLADIEARLRALTQARLGRGRVEMTVSLQLRRDPTVDVTVNESLIEALAQALEALRARGVVSGPLSPGDLLRLPQALSVRERPEEDTAAREALTEALQETVGEALDDLDAMRTREGEFLRQDLETRLGTLAALLDRLTDAAARGQDSLRERLALRVRELDADAAADPELVAQEVVRFVARSDINEEIVRLQGHLEHWRALVDLPEPCGRKLDFLLQEMNREVNTIGSKVEGHEAPAIVVASKAELERMREQAQNVE